MASDSEFDSDSEDMAVESTTTTIAGTKDTGSLAGKHDSDSDVMSTGQQPSSSDEEWDTNTVPEDPVQATQAAGEDSGSDDDSKDGLASSDDDSDEDSDDSDDGEVLTVKAKGEKSEVTSAILSDNESDDSEGEAEEDKTEEQKTKKTTTKKKKAMQVKYAQERLGLEATGHLRLGNKAFLKAGGGCLMEKMVDKSTDVLKIVNNSVEFMRMGTLLRDEEATEPAQMQDCLQVPGTPIAYMQGDIDEDDKKYYKDCILCPQVWGKAMEEDGVMVGDAAVCYLVGLSALFGTMEAVEEEDGEEYEIEAETAELLKKWQDKHSISTSAQEWVVGQLAKMMEVDSVKEMRKKVKTMLKDSKIDSFQAFTKDKLPILLCGESKEGRSLRVGVEEILTKSLDEVMAKTMSQKNTAALFDHGLRVAKMQEDETEELNDFADNLGYMAEEALKAMGDKPAEGMDSAEAVMAAKVIALGSAMIVVQQAVTIAAAKIHNIYRGSHFLYLFARVIDSEYRSGEAVLPLKSECAVYDREMLRLVGLPSAWDKGGDSDVKDDGTKDENGEVVYKAPMVENDILYVGSGSWLNPLTTIIDSWVADTLDPTLDKVTSNFGQVRKTVQQISAEWPSKAEETQSGRLSAKWVQEVVSILCGLTDPSNGMPKMKTAALLQELHEYKIKAMQVKFDSLRDDCEAVGPKEDSPLATAMGLIPEFRAELLRGERALSKLKINLNRGVGNGLGPSVVKAVKLATRSKWCLFARTAELHDKQRERRKAQKRKKAQKPEKSAKRGKNKQGEKRKKSTDAAPSGKSSKRSKKGSSTKSAGEEATTSPAKQSGLKADKVIYAVAAPQEGGGLRTVNGMHSNAMEKVLQALDLQKVTLQDVTTMCMSVMWIVDSVTDESGHEFCNQVLDMLYVRRGSAPIAELQHKLDMKNATLYAGLRDCVVSAYYHPVFDNWEGFNAASPLTPAITEKVQKCFADAARRLLIRFGSMLVAIGKFLSAYRSHHSATWYRSATAIAVHAATRLDTNELPYVAQVTMQRQIDTVENALYKAIELMAVKEGESK